MSFEIGDYKIRANFPDFYSGASGGIARPEVQAGSHMTLTAVPDRRSLVLCFGHASAAGNEYYIAVDGLKTSNGEQVFLGRQGDNVTLEARGASWIVKEGTGTNAGQYRIGTSDDRYPDGVFWTLPVLAIPPD
ncbi:hypothetical protein CTheo_4026 [Ceratobasidium theobromae]|uniref:Uncharacterized protein n=1 Tax=Ceratobasidium theobromae TaxID=1582974 RepID=A0A5N5QLL6_9AGAM|nr:hypothetical protein CTheo_4026 [Ceratobasidium theobromae]